MRSTYNVLWAVSGLGIRTLIQVVYFVLLARVLGPTEYGALSSSLAIIYIFVPYANWGAGDILVKNVARNKDKFAEYWGTALLSIIIFGSIFLMVTLLLYFFLLMQKVNFLPVLLLCVSELYFLKVIDTTIQAYQAFEFMPRTAVVQSVFSIIRLLFTLLFVEFIDDHSVNTWAVLYLASTIITAIFCLIIVRLDLGRGKIVLSHITDNLKEGFYFSLSPSAQSVYNDFDKSILPRYVSLGVTGNYSVAYKMLEALCVPLKGMLQAFYARFFVKGQDGIQAGRAFAMKLAPVFFLYGVFAVLLITIISKYMPLLFGEGYKEVADIIKLLSLVIIFRAMHSLGADTLTGAGMQGIRSTFQLSVAALNAALCLMLIPGNGWMGAAWASLISDGILALLIWIAIFSPPRLPVQVKT